MLDIGSHQSCINYETRWLPNRHLLTQFADHYKLNFISKYSERMSGVYGEATYRDGQLRTVGRNKHDPKPIGRDTEINDLRPNNRKCCLAIAAWAILINNNLFNFYLAPCSRKTQFL